MFELCSDRLRLRQPDPTDFDMVFDLVSDFDVVKMTARWPFPAERGLTAQRCTPVSGKNGQAGLVFLGPESIGMMGILSGDLGYMFARRHWGQGYATEIGRVMVSHAFETYDWEKITACVWLDNPASARVLDKLGFEADVRCKSYCLAQNRDMDTQTYVLPRVRWHADRDKNTPKA